MATPLQYYATPTLQGNYQYIPYLDILNTIEIMAQESDSYIENVKRSQFIIHLKRGIKEVTKQTPNYDLAIELEISDSLTMTLPQDYVYWRRLSLAELDPVSGSYTLRELDINRSINISTGYLQDNNYQILFDIDGNILTSDASNAYNLPFKTYKFGETKSNDMTTVTKYGEFAIDERRGKIVFSSELQGKLVVLEYVSDGLQSSLTDDEITVHKYLEDTLIQYVYYKCIEYKRQVPANEKRRANDSYKTALHKAKLSLMDFNIKAIRRAMRI